MHKKSFKKSCFFCKKRLDTEETLCYNVQALGVPHLNASSLHRSGCGADGSALPWGGRGRWFKSSHSDQIKEALTARLVLLLFRFVCTMQNHEFFQKSSAPFEKISKSSPANINRHGQTSSELVVRKSSHSDQKMQIGFSRFAFFILRGRLEAVSRYHPCTEGARGWVGVPQSERSRALGVPGCGRWFNRCCLQHRSHQTKIGGSIEPPIFLYFTGFLGLLGVCTASKTSANFLPKIGSKTGTTTCLTTFVTKKLYSIRAFGTLRF